jgi:hypothetical protein
LYVDSCSGYVARECIPTGRSSQVTKTSETREAADKISLNAVDAASEASELRQNKRLPAPGDFRAHVRHPLYILVAPAIRMEAAISPTPPKGRPPQKPAWRKSGARTSPLQYNHAEDRNLPQSGHGTGAAGFIWQDNPWVSEETGKDGGGFASSNFALHQSVARKTAHYRTRPSDVGPGAYLGLGKFGSAEKHPHRARPAPKPFDASTPRHQPFPCGSGVPGPAEYEPSDAASSLVKPGRSHTIGLPGVEQFVTTDHLCYDVERLGPGLYELPREPEQLGKDHHVPPTGPGGESIGSSSVFTSRVAREPFPSKAGPGPGDYEVPAPAHFKNVSHDFGHRTGSEHVTDFANFVGKSDTPGPTSYNMSYKATESATPGIRLVARADGPEERLGPGRSAGGGPGPADYDLTQASSSFARAAAPSGTAKSSVMSPKEHFSADPAVAGCFTSPAFAGAWRRTVGPVRWASV